MNAHAIRFDHHGGPDVLDFVEVNLPPPAAGEARVRHTAVGVNFVDTYHRTGLYKVQLPSGLGSEAAGVVEAVGPGVTEVKPGARVAYGTGPLGAYATARNIPAAHLVELPEGVGDETAAGALLKGMTVEYLVRRTFRVERGMTVLWHAAAGGVGLIACQWLRALGAVVIGTASSDEKAALAKAHGATHTIVYTREDVVARVRELTDGKGVPVVYDAVGKDTFFASLDCLKPRGMLVSFGNASGKPPSFDPMLLSQKGSLFLTRASLAHYTGTRDELMLSANALFERIAAGDIRIDVRQRFPLARAADAHRALESRATTGSTVLVP